jgi:hypothetical protein
MISLLKDYYNIDTDYTEDSKEIEYADYLLLCRILKLPVIVKVNDNIAISFLSIKGDENEVLSWIDKEYGNGFKSISFTEMTAP